MRRLLTRSVAAQSIIANNSKSALMDLLFCQTRLLIAIYRSSRSKYLPLNALLPQASKDFKQEQQPRAKRAEAKLWHLWRC